MTAKRFPELLRWLKWLRTEDCTCDLEWKSLGILYRVSMGKGWVHTFTDPACPHHGKS